jgi:phosphatidylserine decarboxylase
MRRLLRAVFLAEYGGDELLAAFCAFGAAALLVGDAFGWAAALPTAAPFLFFLWFFRDPPRRIPDEPGVFVSPADGKIQDISEVDEPDWIGGKAVRIGIFLSPLNVHVNRAPCAGTVRKSAYRRGEFLPAYDPEAATKNESWTLALEAADGLKVLVKQITGVAARRIVCEPRLGQTLARGQRYGMIKFGSRTELYLPLVANCQILVKVGDGVRGGTTVLARRTEPAAGN